MLMLVFANTLPCMSRHKSEYTQADSIMLEVMNNAQIYKDYLQSYTGSAYIKGTSTILRTNKLYDLIPGAFPFASRDKGSMFEMSGEISYNAPNQFVYKPYFTRSTTNKAYELLLKIIPLLNLNVYDDTSFDGKFIMPGSLLSKGLYDYRLDDIIEDENGVYYKIRYTSRNRNLQLINGYIYIMKESAYIYKIEASGFVDIAHFKLSTTFNCKGNTFMLPQNTEIEVTHNILKNVSSTTYQCSFTYSKVDIEKTEQKRGRLIETSKYDLTSFALRDKKDFREIFSDTYWDELRGYALTRYERRLLDDKEERDSIRAIHERNDTIKRIDYQKVSDAIVSNSSRSRQNTRYEYYGVLNPALIGYSKMSGITLRQRLDFIHTFENESRFRITPEVGYSFGLKELTYGVNAYCLYYPEKLGNIQFIFRKGNRGFNASFIENIEQGIDSAGIYFDDLGIDYYRDFHFKLENRMEITNGLLFYVGGAYTLRKPVVKKVIESADVRENYTDFYPYARMEWTPRQYYRYIGRQKVYLDSRCPTISMEYAQGIEGVMGSRGLFKRAELDMHHRVRLNKLRSFNYRIGLGGYFDHDDNYFIDYRYFKSRTYPDTWADRVGGVYNLLNGHWYYASPRYAQVHFMFESPYILLQFLKPISRFILTERLYLSQLYTPTLKCYTEVGYGVGNYIINAGVFASFDKGRYQEIGAKVSFILGKYW